MFALYSRTMSGFDAMIDALERRELRTLARLGPQVDATGRRADSIATALGARVCTRDFD
jgi:hypothetical protein